ncbi:MAG: hypothetical protein H7095_04945 [Pseudopedobacter sp.]|nr:hypothetical protein [Deinococcales bacterium]
MTSCPMLTGILSTLEGFRHVVKFSGFVGNARGSEHAPVNISHLERLSKSRPQR